MVSYIEMGLFKTELFYNWSLFFQVFHHSFCQIKNLSIEDFKFACTLC